MKCPKCSTELIWGGDNDYEDYDAEVRWYSDLIMAALMRSVM